MHNRPQRKSPRLKGFDYSSNGAYFITIKTYRGEHLFGEVSDGTMRLNALGEIVLEEWLKSEELREEVFLDEFVIMPNHFHGIVIIFHPEGAAGSAGQVAEGVGTQGLASLHDPQMMLRRRKRSLSTLISGFKSSVTVKINRLRQTLGADVWQERYYDQIIKTEQHLNNVRQYIVSNPANWATDEDNV